MRTKIFCPFYYQRTKLSKRVLSNRNNEAVLGRNREQSWNTFTKVNHSVQKSITHSKSAVPRWRVQPALKLAWKNKCISSLFWWCFRKTEQKNRNSAESRKARGARIVLDELLNSIDIMTQFIQDQNLEYFSFDGPFCESFTFLADQQSQCL